VTIKFLDEKGKNNKKCCTKCKFPFNSRYKLM
jgi:hypothetical protein